MQHIGEKWNDVKGYEGRYMVSTFGRVKSLKRTKRGKGNGILPVEERILTPLCTGKYLVVGLSDGKTHKQHAIHRLVACAFIDNPENKPQVNHIDENPKNNRVDNLEWVTARENILYGTGQERRKRTLAENRDKWRASLYKSEKFKRRQKPILKLDEHGNLLKLYANRTEVKNDGYNDSHVVDVCKGRKAVAYGFKWVYA